MFRVLGLGFWAYHGSPLVFETPTYIYIRQEIKTSTMAVQLVKFGLRVWGPIRGLGFRVPLRVPLRAPLIYRV